MNSLSKHFFWAIFSLLTIAFVFSLFYVGEEAPEVLSLDQLVFRINGNEISKIVVSGNDLKIALLIIGNAVSKKESESG